MAYQIKYTPPFPRRKTEFPLRMILLTVSFFLLFLLATKVFWPTGSKKLTQLLLPPQGNADLRQAAQVFFTDLKSGTPFYQSLTAFCQEIIRHANIPPV